MLTVKTYIAPSTIHGIGLFAEEDIPEGTVIWEFTPQFDVLFTADDLVQLSESAQAHVEKYSYFDAARDAFVLCGDDARFMNHSRRPNTTETRTQTIARRDIAAGEELTCDYGQLGIDPDELAGFDRQVEEVNK